MAQCFPLKEYRRYALRRNKSSNRKTNIATIVFKTARNNS
jgi:hypothetical protein